MKDACREGRKTIVYGLEEVLQSSPQVVEHGVGATVRRAGLVVHDTKMMQNKHFACDLTNNIKWIPIPALATCGAGFTTLGRCCNLSRRTQISVFNAVRTSEDSFVPSGVGRSSQLLEGVSESIIRKH